MLGQTGGVSQARLPQQQEAWVPPWADIHTDLGEEIATILESPAYQKRLRRQQSPTRPRPSSVAFTGRRPTHRLSSASENVAMAPKPQPLPARGWRRAHQDHTVVTRPPPRATDYRDLRLAAPGSSDVYQDSLEDQRQRLEFWKRRRVPGLLSPVAMMKKLKNQLRKSHRQHASCSSKTSDLPRGVPQRLLPCMGSGEPG